MVMLSRELHPLNAYMSIEVTEEEMRTFVRETQPLKANLPMEVTVAGTVTSLSEVHERKTQSLNRILLCLSKSWKMSSFPLSAAM